MASWAKYFLCWTAAVFGVPRFGEGQSPITKFAFGDPRNCPTTEGVHRFEVLPGGGWDNLRNLDMGQVLAANYSQCKTTEDGKYLIPDHSYTVPLKRSNMEVFAEVINDWKEYTSLDSQSINAEASLFSIISGSFATSFESVRKGQAHFDSVITRVQLRHRLYTIKVQPDAPLHPAFKSRVLDIASHLQRNNSKMASYIAQLIVRDFGTHFLTSLDGGAILAKEDQVLSSFVSKYSSDKRSIKLAASVNFFGKVGFSADYAGSVESSFTSQYNKNLMSSKITSIGGPPFKGNFTVGQWESELENALVAIDRSGNPLHFCITPSTVPELPDPLRRDVISEVFSAVEQYYKYNTHTGCTKLGSKNFDFHANLDDGSCQRAPTNYSFGGLYQTCDLESGSNAGDICADLVQKNPLTGSFRCSDGYDRVRLYKGATSATKSRYECQKHCRRCYLLFTCCDNKCGTVYYSSKGVYESHWCAAKPDIELHQDTGYKFGGLFTDRISNPLTKAQSCPPKFYPLRVGTSLRVCVTDDYELGGLEVMDLPFAGFFSCKEGNPLAMRDPGSINKKKRDTVKMHQLTLASFFSGEETWPKRCPDGYSQHLAVIESGCAINYCVKANALVNADLLPITLPPFEILPDFNVNQTETMIIIGPSKRGWAKDEDSQKWTEIELTEDQKSNIVNGLPLHQSTSVSGNKGLQPGGTTGLVIGLTAGVGLVLAISIFSYRRKRRSKRNKSEETLPIHSDDNLIINHGATFNEGYHSDHQTDNV